MTPEIPKPEPEEKPVEVDENGWPVDLEEDIEEMQHY